MPSGSFTASAVIHGGRWQHHRLRDHFGVESDLYIVLNERLGPWEEGTPIHFVIDDLLARIEALESANRVQGTFTANAYLLNPGSIVESSAGTWRGIFWADAITKRTMSSSFTAQAWLTGGGKITMNAIIIGRRRFTADAVLV
jgi:hypothetical protein